MYHPFIQFLTERDLVSENVAQRLTAKCKILREPIGMIAAGHGLLTPDQIDIILDRQRDCQSRFGEIAIELGHLMPEQVDNLVKIQQFRTGAQITEALVLGSVLSFGDAVQYLGGFLLRDREVMKMMVDD